MIAEVVDGEVLVRHINPAALRIRGVHLEEGEEIVPEDYSTGWVLLRLDGETPVPVEDLPLARALFQREDTEAEPLIVVDEEGNHRWVSINAGPVQGASPDRPSAIAVFHDITDLKQFELNLINRRAELRSANMALEQKNAATRELIEQVKAEKERLATDIETAISRFITPVLDLLLEQSTDATAPLVQLLRANLDALTTSGTAKLSARMLALSRREVEICNLIKSGLTTSEIANMLGISPRSVSNHRYRIRKKLQLTHREISLSQALSDHTHKL